MVGLTGMIFVVSDKEVKKLVSNRIGGRGLLPCFFFFFVFLSLTIYIYVQSTWFCYVYFYFIFLFYFLNLEKR